MYTLRVISRTAHLNIWYQKVFLSNFIGMKMLFVHLIVYGIRYEQGFKSSIDPFSRIFVIR